MLNTEPLTLKAPNEQVKVVTFGNARQLYKITKFESASKMPEFGTWLVKSQVVASRVRQAVNAEQNVAPTDLDNKRRRTFDLYSQGM